MRLSFKRAIALSLLTSISVPVLAAPTFSPDRIKSDVAFLADDLLEGRDSGTRGYDIAALFVAQRFAALGLQPAKGDGWYQMVPLQESNLGKPDAILKIGDTRFSNMADVVIGPSAFEPSQAVTAPVVFVGFGLHSPDRGIDDYAGLDVRGKFVATLSGFPKGMASDVGAHLASEKARVAAEHGAIGTINILTPTALKVASWDLRKHYATGPSFTWIGQDGKPHTSAPGIRASAALNVPVQRALFAGAPKSLDSVLAEAEREGGNPKGFALAQSATVTRTSTSRRIYSPNVIGILPGSDPVLRNEYVVMMGHLDHDGVDPTLKGDQIYNGAMDNAAGVATMLEAARALVEGPRPKRSILFAAVTAEEDGLLGAEYLAKNPVVGNGKVVGVVNLDMPVLTYDFKSLIAFGAEQSTLGKVVATEAAKDGVRLIPDPEPEQSTFTRSDHYNFVKEGVPSVFLATGEGDKGLGNFADFAANHYHKPSDDMNLPINWQAGAKFARINYLIALDIANAPEAPRWYSNSFFGNTFAKDAPKAKP